MVLAIVWLSAVTGVVTVVVQAGSVLPTGQTGLVDEKGKSMAGDFEGQARVIFRNIDTLTYTGTVTGKTRGDGEGLVEVGFSAATDTMGEHLSGTAVVSLPIAGGRK